MIVRVEAAPQLDAEQIGGGAQKWVANTKISFQSEFVVRVGCEKNVCCNFVFSIIDKMFKKINKMWFSLISGINKI